MKKIFEEPNMKTFLLTSDDIMDVLSTEYIDYDEIPEEEPAIINYTDVKF